MNPRIFASRGCVRCGSLVKRTLVMGGCFLGSGLWWLPCLQHRCAVWRREGLLSGAVRRVCRRCRQPHQNGRGSVSLWRTCTFVDLGDQNIGWLLLNALARLVLFNPLQGIAPVALGRGVSTGGVGFLAAVRAGGPVRGSHENPFRGEGAVNSRTGDQHGSMWHE